MKHYLSVCCIFKDEAPYLEEWLRFYSLIGVEHFYLYDNDSTDAFKAVLAPWAAAGKVTLNYTMRCEEHLCTFEPALLKQSGLDPSRPENYHPVCGHIKSIVSPREAIAVGSPHHFLYRHKRPAISAVGAPVPGPFCDDVRIDQLRVNHYFSKCADGGDCGARVRGLSAKPRGMLEGGGRAPRSRGRIPDLAFNLRARQ